MRTLIAAAVVASICFSLGVSYGRMQAATTQSVKRVVGIGGIFFKCKDSKAIRAWYADHLGLSPNQYGTKFESRDVNDPQRKTVLQWTPFKESTTYFAPSDKQFMINYRVENLTRLLDELAKENIKPLDAVENEPYGKFVHLLDPEGNKIELWEPIEATHDESGRSGTK